MARFIRPRVLTPRQVHGRRRMNPRWRPYASQPAGGLAPADGYLAWYDMATSSLRDAGDNACDIDEAVAECQDVSGNALHLDEVHGDPTAQENAIAFDGNDGIRITGADWGDALTTPYTTFCVAKLDDPTPAANQYIQDGQAARAKLWVATNGNITLHMSAGAPSGYTLEDTDYHVYAVEWADGASSLWVDGTEIATDINAGNGNLDGFTLGCHGGTFNGANGMVGQIGQALVYDGELTDAERQQTEAYLMDLYGIE